MRVPDALPPLAGPAQEQADVAPGAPIMPSRRVGENPSSTMTPPRAGEPAREEQAPREAAGGDAAMTYERVGEDRRKLCRRIYKTDVWLDTRTGKERRKDTRRDEDPLTHISKKI